MYKIHSEYPDLDKYVYNRGDILYYKKGTDIPHNPYGSSYIGKNGYKDYRIEGFWHRLDGPARIYPDGKEEYYIYGYLLTKEEFETHPERLKFLGKEHLTCLT